MAVIALVFRCGHEQLVDPDRVSAPRCHCGERVIARTVGVGAPRIVGHARGPHVRTAHLGAVDVSTMMRPAPAVVPVAQPPKDQ